MGDGQELQDRRVAALLGEGVSFRQVAALLGLPLGVVQRSARQARALTPSRVATADPIGALLSPADLEHLGVSAVDGLSMLDKYRFLGLPEGSAAGEAARRLFDHGRGSDAITAWMRVSSDR